MKVLGNLDLNNNSIENARFELIAKIEGGVEDNIVKIDEHGYLVDSGVSISEVGGGGDMSNYYTKVEVNAALEEKQDVLVSGTSIKTINNVSILGEGNITIEGGGGTAVQSDWSQTDDTQPDFILHKPTIPSNTSDLNNDSGFITASSIPDVSNFITENDVATYLSENNYATESDIPDVSGFVESSDLATVATTGDYGDLSNTPDLSGYAQSSSLASVATSGDYGDLSNTPDLSGFVESSDLATVATTGDYEDLSNTPTIPSSTSDLSNDSGFITASDVYSMGFVKDSDLATVATSGDYTDLSNTPSLATVATTGDYGDLSNTPSLATVATTGDYGDLDNTPDLSIYAESSNLAAVATSNDYGDLDNTPDLTDYVTTNDLGTEIEQYLYNNIDTVLYQSSIIGNTPIKDYFAITDTDTVGQYTYTETLGGSDIPMLQFVYDDKVAFTDITVDFGADPDSGFTTVTVTWDNTKYPVDSNNPLYVHYLMKVTYES